MPEVKAEEHRKELHTNVSKLQKQKELSGSKPEGGDFQLEYQDRVLEREVFNMDGLPGRVVHSPKSKRARSFDSQKYGHEGVYLPKNPPKAPANN